jgi:hypothetical protein
MAAEWIKMRLDLAEDPAVIHIADELEIREETVVGYCHAFWCWVSRQCHDGSVTGVTLKALGRRLNLPGFPELLCKVGWLEYDESGGIPTITIPNFERHLSQGAKERALNAYRQRHARVTKTSRSHRDKTVTRVEKSRVEKSRSTKVPPKSPKGDSRTFDPLEIEIPPPLDTPAFQTTWKDWVAHRREKKAKLTQTCAGRQIKSLAESGSTVAICRLEFSMTAGWTMLAGEDKLPRGEAANGKNILSGDWSLDD